MSNLSRRTLFLSLLGGLFFVTIGAGGLYHYLRQAQEREALGLALEWGRMATLPRHCRDLRVEDRGTAFTRELRVSFNAPLTEIREWLERSPGTRGSSGTAASAVIRKYSIAPGGGAQLAEVTVDEQNQSVEIRVYWS